MNMNELITAAVANVNDNQSLDSYSLLECFELDHSYVELEDHGFSTRRIGGWRVDGYVVGKYVVLLDEVPICIANHSKKAVSYEWISKEAFEKTRAKLLELVTPRIEINLVDMNKDMGDGFDVYYGDSIIGNIVILKETGEQWKVHKTFTGYNEIARWEDIVIEKDGVKKEVKTNEIIVPWFNK